MNITVKELPSSRVEVSGELEAKRFDEYIAKTTRDFVAESELAGFRKGKAPEKMVLEHVGETNLLQTSAENALKELWPSVLEDNHIEAIGPAEFHLLKLARGNNLVWQAAITVLPKVGLPDYRDIAKKINAKKENAPVEVLSKEVDETLAYIQKARTPEEATPPPLDDAYAKAVGNFPSLEALKDSIRDGIRSEKEEKGKEAHRLKIIDEIANAALIDIPSLMIDAEREKMLHELKGSIADMGLKWEDYLLHLKKTESDLKKEWGDAARRRVRTGLALREIARKENINPADEEIQAQVERILRPYSDDDRKNIDQSRVKDYAYGIVRNEKVLQLLEGQ